MLLKILVLAIALTMSICILSGCKKNTDEEPPVEIKSMADLEAQAKKDINEDNMASELDKLEKEMEAEESQESN